MLLLGLCLAACPMYAQSYVNGSLQLGYNFSRINPTPYNFAIDSIFNIANAGSDQLLEPARWGAGPTVSLALHRGRASFRLHSRLFFTQSNAITNPSGQTELRTDVSFWGGSVGGDITSLLIDFTRNLGFYVGAGLSGNYFQSATSAVPLDEFEQDDPLEIATEAWQVGFKLHTPIRFIIPEAHVGFSLEPYFMVFFSNLELESFNNALNGPKDRPFIDAMDHFGITASVMVFLNN